MGKKSLFLVAAAAVFAFTTAKDLRTYTIQNDVYFDDMNATSILTGILDIEYNNGTFSGYLRQVMMSEDELAGSPLPDTPFRFHPDELGALTVPSYLTSRQILIIKGIVAQFSIVHYRDTWDGDAGVVSEPTLMGWCNSSWSKPSNTKIIKETYSKDCRGAPIYSEGAAKYATFGSQLKYGTRYMKTEVTLATENYEIETLKTTEIFTSSDLGTVRIETQINNGHADREISDIPPLTAGKVINLLDKDWHDDLIVDNPTFCSRVLTLAGQVAFDTEFTRQGLSEHPKTHVLERYAMLRHTIRHAPTGPGVLTDCYKSYLNLKPDESGEQSTVYFEKVLPILASSMVESGIPDSLKFISYLLQNDPSKLTPISISQIPANVPTKMLTASYLRTFFKLTKKALDGSLPEQKKAALIIAFSQILRKTILENPSPEINLDMKMAYLSFLDVIQQTNKGKLGREPIFIRAYGNIPNQKAWRTFKALFEKYEDQEAMQVFVVGCMDKFVEQYPLLALRTLNEMYYSEIFPSTKVAVVFQMMKTGLLSQKMMNDIFIEGLNGPAILKEAVQVTFTQCAYADAYGPIMAKNCEEVLGDTTIDPYFSRTATYLKDYNTVVQGVPSKFKLYPYLKTETLLKETNTNLSVTIAVLQPFSPLVVIVESNYAQTFLSLSGSELGDLSPMLREYLSLHSNEILVTLPTASGLPFFYNIMNPSLVGWKISSNGVASYTVTGALSSRSQIKMGLLDHFNKKEFVIGKDANIQVYLPPLTLSYVQEKGGMGIKLSLVEPKHDERLAHMSVWPYHVIRDVFYVLPSGEDPNVISRIIRPIHRENVEFENEFNITGIALQFTTKFEELDTDPFRPVTLAQHNIYNFWYNGTKSTTDYLELKLSSRASLARLLQLHVTSNPKIFIETGFHASSWAFATESRATILFHGSPSREYSAATAFASTDSGLFLSLLIKGSIDDAVKYEICSDVTVQEPENGSTKLYGVMEYGETCGKGSNLTITTITKKLEQELDVKTVFHDTTIVHENTPETVLVLFCQLKNQNMTIQPDIDCEM